MTLRLNLSEGSRREHDRDRLFPNRAAEYHPFLIQHVLASLRCDVTRTIPLEMGEGLTLASPRPVPGVDVASNANANASDVVLFYSFRRETDQTRTEDADGKK